MITAAQQNAAARRQLRERGVSEARIAELDAGNLRHIERGGAVDPSMVKPVRVVGWCSEHDRYFFYDRGCRSDLAPTPAEIRASYARR
jgi:hypothetical protein